MSPPELTKTPVLIETSRHQIVGSVTVGVGERLSDYANDPDRQFFAVTEAQMAPLDDPDRMRAVDFILVNRTEIMLLRPGWTAQSVGDPTEGLQPAVATGPSAFFADLAA